MMHWERFGFMMLTAVGLDLLTFDWANPHAQARTLGMQILISTVFSINWAAKDKK